tara:strand:+ start:20164 stop:20343 length:180 start_codon:yes stop_codon:yes gene_type:complete
VTVALDGAVWVAFVSGGADHRGRFGLDQLLQHDLGEFTDQIGAVADAECVEQFGQGRIG